MKGGGEKDAKKIHGSDEKSSEKTRKIQKINKKKQGDSRIGEKTLKNDGKQAGKGGKTIPCRFEKKTRRAGGSLCSSPGSLPERETVQSVMSA